MITISGVRLSSRGHGSPSKEQTLMASRQKLFFDQAEARAGDESLEAYGGAGGCGGVRLMRRGDVLPQIVRLGEVPRVETRWWAGPLTAATLPQASASLALLRLPLDRICGDVDGYRYFGRATQS